MPKKPPFLKLLRLIQKRPLLVGSLIGSPRWKAQLTLSRLKAMDLLEVRLDTFMTGADSNPIELLHLIRAVSKKPLLLTLRAFDENGQTASRRHRLNDLERWRILKPLIPQSAMVDVEIRHLDLAKKMTSQAHRKGCGVIHSYHHFNRRLSFSLLNRMYRRSKILQGDFFKVATFLRREKDLTSFLQWGVTARAPRPILIGMGEAGLPSRFIGYSFGSVMTYGHLGKSAAPGQIPITKLSRSIKDIYERG